MSLGTADKWQKCEEWNPFQPHQGLTWVRASPTTLGSETPVDSSGRSIFPLCSVLADVNRVHVPGAAERTLSPDSGSNYGHKEGQDPDKHSPALLGLQSPHLLLFCFKKCMRTGKQKRRTVD